MLKRFATFRTRSSDGVEDGSVDATPPTFTSPFGSGSSIASSRSPRPPTRAWTNTSRYLSPKGKNTEPDESGPLGLTVLHKPDNDHRVDIVFVHGLGGTSRLTWSKNKDLKLFWPMTFLPLESDIRQARIMTFGYNATFLKAGNASTSIMDFAKTLLFDLKYSKDQDAEDLNFGKVPLIFVVHSMGGLIVKEAYVQGQNDPKYKEIIRAISAITFLATPHRGTTLAQTLNTILGSLMFTSSKQYVSDLVKNSLMLQNINEQFRHIAPRLDIASFYETMPTPIGRSRVMILEKESSILGYPGEVSKSLAADHHHVCKYDDPEDPNYISVRNVLKTLVSDTISKFTAKQLDISDRRSSQDLRAVLAVSAFSGIDYIFFRDKWTKETNHWILNERAYLEWRSASNPTHRLLWISGGAATGKSVMSSFLINQLAEECALCQYFFIRFGDRKKRTLSLLLRSLAFQLAQSVPELSKKITNLSDEAIDFETADPRIIWDLVFKSILLKWEATRPLYWIVDGLDEADDPRAVIKMLSDIVSSSVPVRILFTGRRTSEINAVFENLPANLGFGMIEMEGHFDDLRQHIRQELTVSGTTQFRREVERRIIDASQNNFLWVRLAVERVNKCHTHTDVDRALQQLPMGMEAIYDRMGAFIAKSSTDKELATKILQCVTCAVRVLKVAELSQMLGGATTDMLDPRRTIEDLCGGFVAVDNDGNVGLIHLTAREYLLEAKGENHPFSVDRQIAHCEMFLSCMRCLMSTGLRTKINHNEQPEVLQYAASSWSSHLASATPCGRETVEKLKGFLTSSSILTWIHALAANRQLRVLIRASKDLSAFTMRVKQQDAVSKIQILSPLERDLLETWAVDLLRIVGKFNNMLKWKADAIYKFIPPFCPKSTCIYQLFGEREARNLSVLGLPDEKWDDYLARITIGQGSSTFALNINVAGSYIAILASSGRVFLYDSSDFTEMSISPIKHGEYVDRMQLNSTATLLATYGYKTTKIWEVSSGKCIVSVNSVESKTRPLAMVFLNNNSKLFVGTDDRIVRSLNLNESDPEWEIVADLAEEELEGYIMNSASHIALSNDGSMAAIAYRGHPMSAWEIDGPEHIGHCHRKDEAVAIRELRDLFWHPRLPEVVGLNIEGVVFRWSPSTDEIEEVSTAATKMSISRDGDIFATGDGHGRVKLYMTSTFTLLYQLASQDAVIGLSISPDSRRLYDIRGYYVNAWEPEALVSLREQPGDIDSLSDSGNLDQSSEASISIFEAVDSVTALAGSPSGHLYCSGTAKGVMSLYDTQHGKLADLHISKAKFTIDRIGWSNDGRYVYFTDMSKQINVYSVTQETGQIKPNVKQKAVISPGRAVKGQILQVLLKEDSSQFLVLASSTICSISMASCSIERSLEMEDMHIHQLIGHPADPNLIVGIGPSTIHVFDWNLTKHEDITILWPPSNPSEELSLEDLRPIDSYKIDRALITHDKKRILMQVSESVGRSRRKRFCFFEAAAIPTSFQTKTEGKWPYTTCLETVDIGLSSNTAVALCFLSKDRFVYLSKSFAICSVRVPSNQNPLFSRRCSDQAITSMPPQRRPSDQIIASVTSSRRPSEPRAIEDTIQVLFALPGDWIGRDCLSLCSIWGSEKSLLCSRNGRAAVVKCAGLA